MLTFPVFFRFYHSKSVGHEAVTSYHGLVWDEHIAELDYKKRRKLSHSGDSFFMIILSSTFRFIDKTEPAFLSLSNEPTVYNIFRIPSKIKINKQ